MLQETLLAAWRGLDEFQGRASLRTWLYRIATNRCLNLLRSRGRRPAAGGSADARTAAADAQVRAALAPALPGHPPRRLARLHPWPSGALRDERGDRAGVRRRAATAAAAAAHRALLRDVLGFSAGESATILETTQASVKGALQRARAALAERPIDPARAPLPDSPQERELVGRFADAFERGDTKPWSPCSPTTPG